MKKTLVLASLIATTAAFAPVSVSYADDMGLRICEYVAANDKNRLRSYLKQKNLKLRKVFDKVQCNGSNLLVFAAKSKALEAGEFIIGKTPAKVVARSIDEIAKHSAHLAEEAKDRVN